MKWGVMNSGRNSELARILGGPGDPYPPILSRCLESKINLRIYPKIFRIFSGIHFGCIPDLSGILIYPGYIPDTSQMYPKYIPNLSNIPDLSGIYPGFILDDR